MEPYLCGFLGRDRKLCRKRPLQAHKPVSALAMLLICLAAWCCLTLPTVASGQDAATVSVESSLLDKATRYSITSGGCSITWTAYSAELNKVVVKHASRCPDPVPYQLSLLKEICSMFLARDAHTADFHTLFWGGLVPEQGSALFEMPLRLALAAYKSPGWDARKGRPKQGDINGFVKSLANTELIYLELKELFRGFRRDITLSSVEKVRVLAAGKLPFYDQLRKQGIQASDKLPFDCMAWFSVSAAEGEKIR